MYSFLFRLRLLFLLVVGFLLYHYCESYFHFLYRLLRVVSKLVDGQTSETERALQNFSLSSVLLVLRDSYVCDGCILSFVEVRDHLKSIFNTVVFIIVAAFAIPCHYYYGCCTRFLPLITCFHPRDEAAIFVLQTVTENSRAQTLFVLGT